MGGKIEQILIKDKPVGPFRIWVDEEGPGNAISRTLGDFEARKVGLISDPEISAIEICPPQDEFIVIGSDGLFDFMNTGEVIGFVKK